MNGWQRLWIVLSVLLAIAAGYIAYIAMPNEARLTNVHKTLMAGYAYDMKAIANAKDENTKKFYRENVGTIEDVGNRSDAERKKHELRLAELPGEQREFIISLTLVWLAICIGIYVAGWVAGWVYRGFRPKKV